MKTMLELVRDSVLAVIFHVAPRFANVLVFVVIGRLIGPDQAGVFSLATTYLLIVVTVMRGLDDLLIRQVAREPNRVASYFGNFLLLRVFLAATLYVVLIFVVQNVLHYPATTIAPIIVLTFSVLPDSLAFVGQSVLLGKRRFGAPAIILGGTNLLKSVTGAVVLLHGGNLMDIAWLWLIGSVFGMIALLVVAAKQAGALTKASWLDFGPLRTHWRAAMSFSAITALTALDSQTDTVLISIYRGEADIGWYNAATTITFSLLMLAQAYRFAVYPLMARYVEQAPDKAVVLFQKSVYYMGVIVMPMVAGVLFSAPKIVELVFGEKFTSTIPVLQVLIVSLAFFFIGEPCNRFMLAKDRQRVMVGLLAITAPLNLIINLLLIPRYGVVGAALARTTSSGIFFALNYGYIARNLTGLTNLRNLIRPLVASLIMAVVVLFLGQTSILIVVLCGIVVYAVALWLVRGVLPDDVGRLMVAVNHRIRTDRSQ
jgi:O-antigen/teichoic acid export membrane protein